VSASLPIDPLLPDVVTALRTSNRLVLRAAPGAGKTTRVPGALLDAGLAGGRAVTVVEPRRIAARAAAEYVARARGGLVGGEVGYRVRFARKGGGATRLWFLTEGVFSRDLARDPFLEEVGVVVLDEFHERHLQSDVALAVVRELQDTVRPDLKLVVMSATLDTDKLAHYLPGSQTLTSEGRAHPVDIQYEDANHGRHVVDRVVAAIRRELVARSGRGGPGGRRAERLSGSERGDPLGPRDRFPAPDDLLVFLPGAAEIRRVATELASTADEDGVDVLTLHGDQPLDEQARALRRGPRRRVVLATNVAETALTVEGVSVVIDSGLARSMRFDVRTGLDRLRLGPISRSSATQRAGRAGRLGPGRCIRLWSRAEEVGRRDHDVPEILRVDLGRTLLELAAWGLRDPAALAWLDAPPLAAVERARALLTSLGALGPSQEPTDVGRRMLAMPVAPRLARMLVEAEDLGAPSDGALVAALASERDIVRAVRVFGAATGPLGGGATRDWPPGPSDLLLRMDLFADAARAGFSATACERLGLDVRAVRAVEHTRRQLARRRDDADAASGETLRRCVLAGFPDRVCRRREQAGARAVMVGGTGVVVAPESVVRDAELFVAIDVDGGERGSEARVRLASAVERPWLAEVFPGSVTTERRVDFDAGRGRAVARTITRYCDLLLAEHVRTDVDPAEAAAALAEAVARDPLAALGDRPDVEQLLARLAFLGRAMPELSLPEDPGALLADAVAALASGMRSLGELARADVPGALAGLLTHAQRSALERQAPAEWTLPSGRRARVRYARDRPPSAAARIQELFGLAATPRLAGGRVPLVLELLAPNQRPMQITDDLASFWRTTYAQVRAELRGRYPRHPWPEDPTTATPTSRARRRAGR
jgi:ATP-dependent helicase HrpB